MNVCDIPDRTEVGMRPGSHSQQPSNACGSVAFRTVISTELPPAFRSSTTSISWLKALGNYYPRVCVHAFATEDQMFVYNLDVHLE